jgi:transcriptional regulator with XRE-family HTH domain
MSVECVALRQETPVTFAQKISTLLKEKGWSVSDLAQASGLTFPTVRSYTAKGKNARIPNLANAFKLADALGVSVEAFKECEDFANGD